MKLFMSNVRECVMSIPINERDEDWIKQNFCPAPWINISTDVNGSIRPCCRYEQPERQREYQMPWMFSNNTLHQDYNGIEMQKLRKAFLRGKKPYECNWCWSEESVGIKSFRQKYLEREYEIDWEKDDHSPQILDLKLSNVCNLKCRMCGPRASSLIAKEEEAQNPNLERPAKENQGYFQSFKIMNTGNEQEFFDLWAANIKELELTGGEPFFSIENKMLIDALLESNHCEHIDLLITTNAMFYIPALMEKMKKFKRVRFSLSIDDIGTRLEYARSGAKWDIIRKNITEMTTNYSEFDIKIYRTINNFNIYHLQELDDWAMNNNIQVIDGFLHEAKELCIQYLPDWAKEEVNEKYKNSNSYQHILDFMNVDMPHLLLKFIRETKKLDKIRNENYREIDPEWSEILMYE